MAPLSQGNADGLHRAYEDGWARTVATASGVFPSAMPGAILDAWRTGCLSPWS